MDPVQTGFQFANELAKQLITLSTGILALSITFTKDIIKGLPPRAGWLLKAAWVSYFFCIIFGIWTMMALTGTLMPAEPTPAGRPLSFGGNIRLPATLQIVAFVVATVFIVSYGAVSLNALPRPEAQGTDAGRRDEVTPPTPR